ncbi:MAG: helix-turn-helix domain-containing protein [Sulfuricaulis sp.]
MSKKDDSPFDFGERLAALRKAAGYTQIELAEILGISQRMVAYYENAPDLPLAKMLRHLARTLSVSTDELIGLAPLRTPLVRRTDAGVRKKRKT